jgi:uncharacterized GH25 family protein
MESRKASMSYLKLWFVVLFGALLASCGGGGGSSGTPISNSAASATSSIGIAMFDSGTVTNRVSATGSTTAKAAVYDKNGSAVPGVKVSFSVGTTGLVDFLPTSGEVLTDANGIAEIVVKRSSLSASGAGTLSAVALVGGVSTTGSYDFYVGSASGKNISLGLFDGNVPTSLINQNGSTVLRATVVDRTGAPVANRLVTATASAADLVTFSPSTSVVTNANGVAEITVKRASTAATGAGSLSVSASVDGETVTSSIDFQIIGSTAVVKKVTIKLFSNGAQSSRLPPGNTNTAQATVIDKDGKPVANTKVTFSTTNTDLISFSPASGAVLTNDLGIAEVTLKSASLLAEGAGTLVATATVDGAAETGSADYQVSASNITLGAMNVGTGTLQLYGNRAVSVVANVNGSPATTGVQVSFSASCGTVSPTVVITSGNGLASTTYTADQLSCAGSNITVRASASGGATASGSIAVGAAQATNIQFVSAAPQLIYLQGSAGATQSQVKFKVIDNIGAPLQNQPVRFSLVNLSPGVSLNTLGNTGTVDLTTDASGIATVSVFAGTVPTSAQIRAALVSNLNISAVSNVLTSASGRAVQSSMSLASDAWSIDGLTIDGTTATLSISLSDRQSNPVPDGTEVNVVASHGVITPPVCVTANSRCTVSYRSQGIRPPNGRVAILAYAPGEENFTDLNANNIYDPGEPFFDQGNAYRDDNFDAVYNNGEFSVPRGSGVQSCPIPVRKDKVPDNSKPNTCDGVWGAIDVRMEGMLLLTSAQSTVITNLGWAVSTPSGTSTVPVATGLTVSISDQNNNSAATGSTINTSVTKATGSSECVIQQTAPTKVANPGTAASAGSDTARLIYPTAFSTSASIVLDKCSSGNVINVWIVTPLGNASPVYSFTIP